MKKTYVVAICGALLIPLIVIIVLFCMKTKLRSEHQELEEQFTNTLNEIEEAPEEVVYVEVEPSKYTNKELNKENILDAIASTKLTDETLNVVSTLFTLLDPGFDNWAIDYNQGYCDVFRLYTEDSDLTVTVWCYAKDYVVAKCSNSSEYVYTHGEVLISLNDKIVEALCYMLQKYDTWNWNMSESALVAGQLQEMYPDNNYVVNDGGIILDNGVTVQISNGVLQYVSDGSTTGIMYAMYPRLQSAIRNSDLVDTENWAPIESLDIIALIEAFEKEGLTAPEDSLVDILSTPLPVVYESWTYVISDNGFAVYTVELDDSYEEGYKKRELFIIDLNTGDYRIFY